MQGRSLVPLLKGEARRLRTDFFYEHLFERDNIPKSEGVRTERFTYVRWFEQKPLVEELYDHTADFDEVKNLIADPRFAAVAIVSASGRPNSAIAMAAPIGPTRPKKK